ncbi:MAG: sigma-54 dependent transcriptional regulator, partial [Verrucomicrobiia bacterium]
GIHVTSVRSMQALLALLEKSAPDVVLCDLALPGGESFSLVDVLRERFPLLPVVLMTADGTTETAIEATKRGAYDYLLKPFEIGELIEIVKRAARSRRMMTEVVPLDGRGTGELLVGRSRAMQEIYKELGRVASKPVTVLIRGETGTGKELIARAIYQHGHRAHLPFIAVNCAAIPETLLESELFGHEKGAFTGADHRRIGRFEQAHNGTIFLDEIGEISPGTQAKLLRVLQERTIQRLGGREDIPVDVRVIAATNRDLERMIEERAFRADLFYRLNVVTIAVPPLRQRRDDIPLLVRHFLKRFAEEFETPTTIEEEAVEFLMGQPWPGNVRQLENVVRRSLLGARGFAIGRDVVEQAVAEANRSEQSLSVSLNQLIAIRLGEAAEGKAQGVYAGLLKEFERETLAQAIRLAGGNQSRAARWLGITRLTLREKLIQFGLHPRELSEEEVTS